MHSKTQLCRAVQGALVCLALGTGAGDFGLASAHAADDVAASAQAAVKFAVPAGPLATSLTIFASDAGVHVSAPAELVKDQRTSGVGGVHSVADALGLLLAGTGLEAVASPNGGYNLRKKATVPAGAPQVADVTLGAITVSGKAPGSTTEGTGSYTTFSTSSSTRLNLTPQETPQPITVITRQRIEDQGLVGLPEVLDAAAGITVKAFRPGGDSPQMWARGASITNFQIDGIPSSASMSNYIQSTVLYDRVEIVKGATGMMSGLGTPSATINMIRKRPSKEEDMGNVSVEGGNWSRYGAGLDVSRRLNEDASVRGRLVADYKRQGSWTDNYRQDYGVLYGIGEVDLGPRTLLTAGFSHLERNTDAPMAAASILYTNGQPTGIGLGDADTPPWSYYDHQHSNVFSSIEHSFDSGWSAKAELSHARYEYDAVVAAMTTATLPGASATVTANHWVSRVEQTSLDAYVTGPFSLFGRRQAVIAGVTLSSLDQSSPSYGNRQQRVSDIFSWVRATTAPVFTQNGDSSSKEHQYGAYLNTRLQLSDAAGLLLGSRITNWKRDRNVRTYATNASTDTHTREDHVVIPYAGLVYALNNTYSLYASYTEIFRPQDSGTLMYTPTGQMDPEEGYSYEAGLKASFYDGALTSSMALFRTRQDNLAIWNPISYAYEAANNATTEGFELELNGRLAQGWQLSAGYNYTETQDKNGKRILPRIPRNTVKLFTTYRLPGDWKRLTLGGGVQWETRTGDPLATYTQNSYALVNLMARYALNGQVELTAHLNNALDKRYYAALAGTTGMAGAPRNFMVAVKYNF